LISKTKNYFYSKDYQEALSISPTFSAFEINEIDQMGQINGSLVGVIQNESQGRIPLLSNRSVVRGGPYIEKQDPAVLKSLLKKYINFTHNRAIVSQFRNSYDMSVFKEVFFDLGFTYEDHLNFIFDLSLGVDRLWDRLDKIAKKNITRAYKKGTAVSLTSSTDEIVIAYRIIQQLYSKLGLPFVSEEFIVKLSQLATPSEGLRVFNATNDSEIIGARMVLIADGYIYDYYAASKEEYYNKYPNDILPWEIIKWGAENGMELFDFGGAGHPEKEYGVREYKRKFGGELVNYGRYEYIHKPLLYKIASFGFNILRKFK
jgi:lipid II:glycine glycyltransferase (peptidoglycan interpeptide bridge formation enzyme)